MTFIMFILEYNFWTKDSLVKLDMLIEMKKSLEQLKFKLFYTIYEETSHKQWYFMIANESFIIKICSNDDNDVRKPSLFLEKTTLTNNWCWSIFIYVSKSIKKIQLLIILKQILHTISYIKVMQNLAHIFYGQHI